MSNRGTLFSSWEEIFEELETVCLTGAPCSHPGRKYLRSWRQCVCLTGAPCSHPERKYLRSWRQCV